MLLFWKKSSRTLDRKSLGVVSIDGILTLRSNSGRRSWQFFSRRQVRDLRLLLAFYQPFFFIFYRHLVDTLCTKPPFVAGETSEGRNPFCHMRRRRRKKKTGCKKKKLKYVFFFWLGQVRSISVFLFCFVFFKRTVEVSVVEVQHVGWTLHKCTLLIVCLPLDGLCASAQGSWKVHWRYFYCCSSKKKEKKIPSPHDLLKRLLCAWRYQDRPRCFLGLHPCNHFAA